MAKARDQCSARLGRLQLERLGPCAGGASKVHLKSKAPLVLVKHDPLWPWRRGAPALRLRGGGRRGPFASGWAAAETGPRQCKKDMLPPGGWAALPVAHVPDGSARAPSLHPALPRTCNLHCLTIGKRLQGSEPCVSICNATRPGSVPSIPLRYFRPVVKLPPRSSRVERVGEGGGMSCRHCSVRCSCCRSTCCGR